jgi:hypothetical protein
MGERGEGMRREGEIGWWWGKKVRWEVLEGWQPQASMRSAKAEVDQLASLYGVVRANQLGTGSRRKESCQIVSDLFLVTGSLFHTVFYEL